MKDGLMKPFLSEQEIASRVQELGEQISLDHQDQEIVAVCVLKGAFVFAADLIRAIDRPLQVEFIGVASYEGTKSTGHVRITNDLVTEIRGKAVLLIEDIIDTGRTIDFLLETLKLREPASIRICSFLSKPEIHDMKNKIDYVGFEVGSEFLIGYGLDLDGDYRQIPYVAQLPDGFVADADKSMPASKS